MRTFLALQIDKETKKTCIPIFFSHSPKDVSERFSFTSTCQDWTTNQERAVYQQEEEAPYCWTPENVKIYPASIAGFALTISPTEDKEVADFSSGRLCNSYLRLLCIQQ